MLYMIIEQSVFPRARKHCHGTHYSSGGPMSSGHYSERPPAAIASSRKWLD